MQEPPGKKKRRWLWLLLPAALLLGIVLRLLDIPHVTVKRGDGHFSVTVGSVPERSSAPPPPEEEQISFSNILKDVTPSLVTVTVGEETEIGVIVTKDGYIVTEKLPDGKASVTLADGRVFPAELVDCDDDCGLTVLKIEAEDLTAAHFNGRDLLSDGSKLGALGVTVSDLPVKAQRFFRLPEGAHVISVDASSNAFGLLREGDIIVTLDRTPIHSTGDLLAALENRRAGETVSVAVMRHGRRETVKVSLVEKQ